MTQQRIDAAWTVNELLHRHPDKVSVLHSFGIDACCGGALSLEEAARRHGVELVAVLRALESPKAVECACRCTPAGI